MSIFHYLVVLKLGRVACFCRFWNLIRNMETFENNFQNSRLSNYFQVPIVNNTVCDAAYQRNNINETAMLCAGYAEGGIDAWSVVVDSAVPRY